MEDRRLLLVHAHPDDESITTGATMAKYAAEGAHVTLVTCTRGEEGEVIPAPLEHLTQDGDALAQHRVGELDKACLLLGVPDHRFLGEDEGRQYRDSGMMGVPSNERPESLWQADLDTAARDLAAVVRQVRPHVVVTYDANGGYGHPDHIRTHQVTLRAVELAGSPALPGEHPWQTRKVYAIAVPRSVLAASVDRLRAAPGSFTAPDSMEDLWESAPDQQVTTRIDGTEQWAAKTLALRAHGTQITVDGERFALSNGIAQEISAVEYFTLLRGPASRPTQDGYETDLFA
ncbi:N-acetyl-1-D-myo-inositol-2-amino-2-deoxy-alpha-D-glucopyranoside deacetylase [Spiractinospora alimapuensis]|uniref:N-acetyl-1-D-myo-inositol-2-amino-2-deoxy-alpha- D-glucopyranoside deacetylase n=1 Tax=Spiractinospora alimapuensis TaxID=2820884 RepID=UPI001EEC5F4E|nr:N-acetyl-1-D-myo-inositol-2-amino-2-deoxy-alpha-D-glucopyranoside deacetylase [Spiractinospora alimapuensis]QVQ54063.1 N-acetyl-1-D-myo-inositol-2-amino-2-deoxy-alpha-D-glucopyranoside deacetylase [Spiractinospora alimapuensis]